MYRRTHDGMTGRPHEGCIVRIADGAHIPADPGNTDWQTYQAWLKAGNTPAEPPAVAGQAPPAA